MSIRWINNYIGTGAFNAVSVQQVYEKVDVRDLVDKSGNPEAAIRDKIVQCLELIRQNKKIVVCCDYGISRSNSIAVGVIKEHESISFREAYKRVLSATGENEIKIEMLDTVRSALTDGVSQSNNRQNKNILITGGSGYIGKYLYSSIKADFNVFKLCKADIDLSIDPIGLDLFVKEYNVETIVHLAKPRTHTSSIAVGETLNILKNVLDVCRLNSTRLIFLSSTDVYSGYVQEPLYVSEKTTMHPKGTYGETKFLSEVLLNHFVKIYGLNTLVFRSSSIYGTLERPIFLSSFFQKAKLGETIKTHKYINGEPILDLLHIEDLIRILSKGIKSDATGVYNIGSGIGVSTFEIAKYVVKSFNSKSEVETVTINDCTPEILVDTSLVKSKFDWKPEFEFWGSLRSLTLEV